MNEPTVKVEMSFEEWYPVIEVRESKTADATTNLMQIPLELWERYKISRDDFAEAQLEILALCDKEALIEWFASIDAHRTF
jgi:hypothetical protein